MKLMGNRLIVIITSTHISLRMPSLVTISIVSLPCALVLFWGARRPWPMVVPCESANLAFADFDAKRVSSCKCNKKYQIMVRQSRIVLWPTNKKFQRHMQRAKLCILTTDEDALYSDRDCGRWCEWGYFESNIKEVEAKCKPSCFYCKSSVRSRASLGNA